MMRTIEEKVEMFTMREQGHSFREIAEKFGLNKEQVRRIVCNGRQKIPTKNVRNCVFPEIRNWMIDNGISVIYLARYLGISCASMSSKLVGSTQFKKTEIDKIIEKSGIQYEKLFVKESNT